MQSFSWYVKRLKSMSAEEVTWRLRSQWQDAVECARIVTGRLPSLEDATGGRGGWNGLPSFRVTEIPPGAWADAQDAQTIGWRDALTRQADRLGEHRLSFFDLEDHFLGNPIDWNRDHSADKATPMGLAPYVDYRDFKGSGDCKLVWEPNRHHHLVVLARAYRATGELRYATEVLTQLDSWLVQCPYGRGMNWRSPMELAIRLISWVWALDLIHESGLFTGDLRRRVFHSAYLHLRNVSQRFSRGSSANNHLIGEAAGVFIGASYFSKFTEAAHWREESRNILMKEIEAQTHPDGCNREQALGYQFFVLQFFLLAGLVGRWTGSEFPSSYWSAIERMLEFVAALREGGYQLPLFGDADDGYVLDVGGRPDEVANLLSLGAAVFGRADFKHLAGGAREPVSWLLGHAGISSLQSLPETSANQLASRGFPACGHYLLQCGSKEPETRVSVLFDCAELGFQSIAGHGHADALSFTVRAFGEDLLVDPGTFDYFTYPEWRAYFRSTRAHNTLEIDGQDQSTMLGPFLWGQRAQTRCLQWEAGAESSRVTGEHDGYRRLEDPVTHRRTLELEVTTNTLTITDEIDARSAHRAALYFHLSESCSARHDGGNRYVLNLEGGQVAFELDNRLSIRLVKGSEAPIGGWISRGYHRKLPATTMIAETRLEGTVRLVCKMKFVPRNKQ